MTLINPKLHIICGMCGCNSMLTYEIKTEINDDTNEEYPVVYIICDNCSTVTDLCETLTVEK